MEHQPPSHPSGRGRTYIGINVFFIVFSSLLVGLRFWARRLKKTFYGWDDWWILVALIIYYGQAALNFWVIYHGGLGYHAAEAGELGVKNTFLQLTVSQFIYAVQFFTIRLSICYLLKRIFVQRWLQKTIWVAIVINIAWALFVIISALTVCRPIAYNWDLSIKGGKCENGHKLNTYIANAVWTILYDTFLWSLPQLIVWRLHMRLATKIALSMVFALGIFDIIISIVRITYVTKVNFHDVTYDDYNAQVWTVVEVSIAIIVACLPICRVVIQHFLPGHFLSHTLKQHVHTKSWGHSVEMDDNRPLGRREQQAESDLFDEEAAGGDVEMQAVTVPPAAVHADHVSGSHEVARREKSDQQISDEAAIV